MIVVGSSKNFEKRFLCLNYASDDFLRFIPQNLGIERDDLRIWAFLDSDHKLITDKVKEIGSDAQTDLSEDGKIKVLKITRTETPSQIEGEPPLVSESVEVLAEFSGDEVGWPYSDEWRMSQPELGKFLGFQKL